MRIDIVLFLMVALLIGMYYDGTDEPLSPKEMTRNLTTAETSLLNISNHFQYQSMYTQEPTVEMVFNNIISAVIYPLVVLTNTAMPMIPYIMAGQLNGKIMLALAILVGLYFIGLVIGLIKLSIIMYFFIREKHKTRTKWYE